ncbi:MAG: hypothetical protein V1766_14045 [Pseudomonadota bacterium]
MPPLVYADKGCCCRDNREFLGMNGMGDGIMKKNQIKAVIAKTEMRRNKGISEVPDNTEQYFGITHENHGAGKARFITIIKESWDHLCGAMAFNIKRSVRNLRKRERIAATWGNIPLLKPVITYTKGKHPCQVKIKLFSLAYLCLFLILIQAVYFSTA